MKSICRLFLLLTAFIYLSPAVAEDQFEKDIEAIREIYLAATDGNKRAVRKAIKSIAKIERKYPNHPLVMSYKGGALSLRGMNIGARPLNRMRETEEGLRVIDRALRMLPRHKGNYLEAVEAQLVAAYIFINLPDSIFHRLKEGNHLVEKLLAHNQISQMPDGLQAAIYFAAATSAGKYEAQDRVKHYLELTLKTDPDGKNAKEAQALLKDIAG